MALNRENYSYKKRKLISVLEDVFRDDFNLLFGIKVVKSDG